MEEEQYDTSNGFGWPVSLKTYKLGDNILFNIQAVINYLGLENQVKNHLLTSSLLKMVSKYALNKLSYKYGK